MRGKIVCFGDSITYGEFVPSNLTWPVLMRDMLPGWRIIPRAVCGETTRQALERFPRDVQASPPDVLVIQFGHNDANRWDSDNGMPRVTARSFGANLEEMHYRALAFDVKHVVYVSPHPVRNLSLGNYIAEMHEQANAFSGAFVNTSYVTPDHLLPDGLHLNEDGHRLYAELVGKELARCLL